MPIGVRLLTAVVLSILATVNWRLVLRFAEIRAEARQLGMPEGFVRMPALLIVNAAVCTLLAAILWVLLYYSIPKE